jgi:hypothetical protein
VFLPIGFNPIQLIMKLWITPRESKFHGGRRSAHIVGRIPVHIGLAPPLSGRLRRAVGLPDPSQLTLPRPSAPLLTGTDGRSM